MNAHLEKNTKDQLKDLEIVVPTAVRTTARRYIAKNRVRPARACFLRRCPAKCRCVVKFRPKTTTSERQLCIALAATGRTVSLDDLSAWRKDGLLPPLAKSGLGRGKGQSYYWGEENILAQAKAAYDALQHCDRADQALIEVFLSGFAVPLAQLRRAWLHRAKMRKPPAVRIVQKSLDTGALLDSGVDRLLLQAALCVGAAVETDDAPQPAAMMAMLDRALSKLWLTRDSANDTGMLNQLWQLLNIIGSVLDASDLVREASDDELSIAQRHLGVAMEFLSGCGDLSKKLADALGPQLFLFFLTLSRSGQVDTLDRMMAYVDSARTGRHPSRRPKTFR